LELKENAGRRAVGITPHDRRDASALLGLGCNGRGNGSDAQRHGDNFIPLGIFKFNNQLDILQIPALDELEGPLGMPEVVGTVGVFDPNIQQAKVKSAPDVLQQDSHKFLSFLSLICFASFGLSHYATKPFIDATTITSITNAATVWGCQPLRVARLENPRCAPGRQRGEVGWPWRSGR